MGQVGIVPIKKKRGGLRGRFERVTAVITLTLPKPKDH